MTKLSVNINKIATLRNARGEDYPNLVKSAQDIIGFGAQGITAISYTHLTLPTKRIV